jgi:hypothetical protein
MAGFDLTTHSRRQEETVAGGDDATWSHRQSNTYDISVQDPYLIIS